MDNRQVKKSMTELDRKSVDNFKSSVKLPLVVVLDEVRSMHNVGSVFRTADSFLIEAIYLCGYSPTPPHRDIQKTALGATETVEWKHWPDTLQALESLRKEGYEVLAVEQAHGSTALHETLFSTQKKYALVFGNEVNGVSEMVLKACNAVIEIPQLGSKHSLNISVSAGIVLWEIAKRFIQTGEMNS